MSNDKIEVGDIVSVEFGLDRAFLHTEALYAPCATGDSWRLKLTDGSVMYVQQFEFMIRKEPTDEPTT